MRIFKDINKIEVFYDKGDLRKVKCFCGKLCDRSIVTHMKKVHPGKWERWCLDFVRLRNKGWSHRRIMWRYRAIFSWTIIEREIQRIIEQRKASLTVWKKRKIDRWEPLDFQLESTSIWSFPKRGQWASHQGDYRGNWPPQIPRNLILRYSKPGDIIFDPFVGGGTTLIEACLLRRKSIGIDINPVAVKMSNERIKELFAKRKKSSGFLVNKFRPIILKGTALESTRILAKLGFSANSIDLVCAHPPYLNTLRYTEKVDEDLSHIGNIELFCDKIQQVAREIHMLLKNAGRCAILIGDIRKNKKIIPLGFRLMERFLKENFKLEEIIIKKQHKDQSTEFYFKKGAINYLIAHEYLFIFRKGT